MRIVMPPPPSLFLFVFSLLCENTCVRVRVRSCVRVCVRVHMSPPTLSLPGSPLSPPFASLVG